MRSTAEPVQEKRERTEEEDLVSLGGVPGNTISKVDSPRQRGRFSKRVVRQSGKQAADTANRDTETERNGKEVSGACGDALELFGQFHAEPTAQQAAHDGFASAWHEYLGPTDVHSGHLLKQTENSTAQQGAYGCRRDDGPALLFVENVPSLPATLFVSREPEPISKRLEE